MLGGGKECSEFAAAGCEVWDPEAPGGTRIEESGALNDEGKPEADGDALGGDGPEACWIVSGTVGKYPALPASGLSVSGGSIGEIFGAAAS